MLHIFSFSFSISYVEKGNNYTRIAPSLCLIEIGVFKKI